MNLEQVWEEEKKADDKVDLYVFLFHVCNSELLSFNCSTGFDLQ